ncbi:uridine kinase [Micropruina sonneratiae]|uniref:uridine kinase n=1 Tax=Micropruina sonneratiae TaxID=2986940 RepID=UPI002226C24F|nr:uridine kinase [Micropruina sp. KQZ13P-5]MCW3158326.1 uridine kinase [Micropruina sp. KQZ13P-5]
MDTRPTEPLARKAGLAWLVSRIRPRAGRTLVAVDGVDGAGKTTFANDLATELTDSGLRVIRISLDDFLNPPERRYAKGRSSPEGFVSDTYDYRRFVDDVLEPLGPEGGGRYRPKSYDYATETPLSPPWEVAPDPVVVVVDGMFLHSDQLRDARGRKVWDLSAWLEVPPEVSVRRLAERDGSPPDPDDPRNHRYVEGQRLYVAAQHPAERADLVVDNS